MTGKTKEEKTKLFKDCRGKEKTFDISEEALKPYGFSAYQRVKTPLGDATVIGVADNVYGKKQLWFHVDTKIGAGWLGCQSKEEFEVAGIKAM